MTEKERQAAIDAVKLSNENKKHKKKTTSTKELKGTRVNGVLYLDKGERLGTFDTSMNGNVTLVESSYSNYTKDVSKKSDYYEGR